MTADGATVPGDAGLPEAIATTRDTFFGGRLALEQPARGHRCGTDAVLLAAAAPAGFAGLAYDVGAGVGAAGLGVALRCPAARVVLVERDPVAADLAGRNAAASGLAARVARCDVLLPAERRRLSEPADLVLTNPPFYDAARVRASPYAARRGAHVLDAGITLADWLRACLALAAPRGMLALIVPAAALPQAVAALDGPAGDLVACPVHPRRGEPARRVLLRARKGSRAPFALAPPLVLHEAEAGAGFTAEAERLHRGEAALNW